MTYTIEKVTTLIGARRYGDNDTNIGFILTDSRSLCFPEETLFFALKSERNDGHNYIPELYRRGVKNFVVTNVPKGYASDYPGANFLKVVNTLEALQRLAERTPIRCADLNAQSGIFFFDSFDELFHRILMLRPDMEHLNGYTVFLCLKSVLCGLYSRIRSTSGNRHGYATEREQRTNDSFSHVIQPLAKTMI